MCWHHLVDRDSCVQCPSISPVCNCGPSQVCVQTSRNCSQCSSAICEDQGQPSSPNSDHGVSAGVVAGAVVGSIVFLAFSVGLFLWWRRRNPAALQPSVQEVKDIPAPADTVLNRPLDPTVTSQSSAARSDSSHSNPFGDNYSSQTTSTGTGSQSTNVIPITFVPASVPPSRSLPQANSTSLVHNSRAPRVELLSEVPTTVPGRQVASAAKAAVVSTPSARSLTSRPSTRSPLIASSFGPQDILHEADESHPLPDLLNLFTNQRSSEARSSMATRGSTQAPQDLRMTSDQDPWNPGSGVNDSDRPLSTYTQVASVMGGPTTLDRMSSGRVVSNPLQRQQESSLATMQAQAQQSEKVQAIPQRMSMSTMASGVSGRADSILESFTFVPPSPISNRPLHTPPRSPLVQETHHVRDPPTPIQDDGVLEPPNRGVLGMSSGSQLSSMSMGLGSFPFQFDHGSEDPADMPPSWLFMDKDEGRASLDTLTLTRDSTSSYPS